jgi:hypothetical protein
MAKRKAGGYIWNQMVNEAKQANERARRALQHIVDDRPGPTQTAIYIAEAALALGENRKALDGLEGIINGEQPGRGATQAAE